MLEYITTSLSRLFEGVWLRGVMFGLDQGPNLTKSDGVGKVFYS